MVHAIDEKTVTWEDFQVKFKNCYLMNITMMIKPRNFMNLDWDSSLSMSLSLSLQIC